MKAKLRTNARTAKERQAFSKKNDSSVSRTQRQLNQARKKIAVLEGYLLKLGRAMHDINMRVNSDYREAQRPTRIGFTPSFMEG